MRRQVNSTLLLALSAAALSGLTVVGCSGGGSSSGGSRGSTVAGSTSTTNLGAQSAIEITPQQPITVDNDLGAGFQILVDGVYNDGNTENRLDLTRNVVYTVENEQVARIGGDGLIVPVANGTTKIAATYNGFTATTTVTVAAASSATPTFAAVELFPKTRELRDVHPETGKEQLQQMLVLGTDSTGRLHDLTRAVGVTLQSTTGDKTVLASVSPNGLLRGVANGEVIAVGRVTTAGLVAGSSVVLGTGIAKPVDPNSLYSGAPLAGSTNPVDQAIYNELFKQFIEPAALSSDGEFVKRLYSDALNRAPTEAEVSAFLANGASDKRELEINKVLADPAFAARWAEFMAETFEIERNANGDAFVTWATTAIGASTPLSTMISEIAAGNVASFDAQHTTPDTKAGSLLQATAGMSAKCATCHDHPLVGPNDTVQWTQVQFYPIVAFFANNAAEATPLDGRTMIRVGNPQQPGFILNPNATITTTLTDTIAARRTELAGVLSASSAFNRGMGHRIFAEIATPLLNPNQFLQVNLDAVAIPAVLNAVETLFARDTSFQGFLKSVFMSSYYQLSSDATTLDPQFDRLMQRRTLVRMHAETVETALNELTGVAPAAGDRAFLRQTFGFPFTRISVAERVDAVNMSQALVLNNSPIVQSRVAGAKIAQLATSVGAGTITQTDAITSIFRAALGRDPVTAEITCANDAIGSAANLQEGLEDVAAAVVGTIEFVTK
jgi:hypothetical protein